MNIGLGISKISFETFLNSKGGKTKTGQPSKRYGSYLKQNFPQEFNRKYEEWVKEKQDRRRYGK